MKKYAFGAAFLLAALITPLAPAQAAGLTTEQATNLIAVVQAAPGVPASAFVPLLTSFTVGTPATQPAEATLTSGISHQPSVATVTGFPVTIGWSSKNATSCRSEEHTSELQSHVN